MAQQPRDTPDSTVEDVSTPRPGETSDTERERIRSSNDRDQTMEREGETSQHNRGYDEAVQGRRSVEDVTGGENRDVESLDPDSAAADVERDDTVTE